MRTIIITLLVILALAWFSALILVAATADPNAQGWADPGQSSHRGHDDDSSPPITMTYGGRLAVPIGPGFGIEIETGELKPTF